MRKRCEKLRIGSKQSVLVKCIITSNVHGKIELETHLRYQARVRHHSTCLSLVSPKTEVRVWLFYSGCNSKGPGMVREGGKTTYGCITEVTARCSWGPSQRGPSEECIEHLSEMSTWNIWTSYWLRLPTSRLSIVLDE